MRDQQDRLPGAPPDPGDINKKSSRTFLTSTILARFYPRAKCRAQMQLPTIESLDFHVGESPRILRKMLPRGGGAGGSHNSSSGLAGCVAAAESNLSGSGAGRQGVRGPGERRGSQTGRPNPGPGPCAGRGPGTSAPVIFLLRRASARRRGRCRVAPLVVREGLTFPLAFWRQRLHSDLVQ